MVIYTSNPSIQESEAGMGLCVCVKLETNLGYIVENMSAQTKK